MTVLKTINASLNKAFWISTINVFCGLTTILDSVTFVSAKVTEEHFSPSIRPVVMVENMPEQAGLASGVVGDSPVAYSKAAGHCASDSTQQTDGYTWSVPQEFTGQARAAVSGTVSAEPPQEESTHSDSSLDGASGAVESPSVATAY
ncbi:MAG: hypothetical protein AAGI72_01280 [Pseudomonadota bacterium]